MFWWWRFYWNSFFSISLLWNTLKNKLSLFWKGKQPYHVDFRVFYLKKLEKIYISQSRCLPDRHQGWEGKEHTQTLHRRTNSVPKVVNLREYGHHLSYNVKGAKNYRNRNKSYNKQVKWNIFELKIKTFQWNFKNNWKVSSKKQPTILLIHL